MTRTLAITFVLFILPTVGLTDDMTRACMWDAIAKLTARLPATTEFKNIRTFTPTKKGPHDLYAGEIDIELASTRDTFSYECSALSKLNRIERTKVFVKPPE